MKLKQAYQDLVSDCEKDLLRLEHDSSLRTKSELISCLIHSIKVMDSEDSKTSLERVLSTATEEFERKVHEKTGNKGWFYSKLNLDTIIAIKTLIYADFWPGGSDAQELYTNAIPNFLRDGKTQITENPWCLPAYTDLLMQFKDPPPVDVEERRDHYAKRYKALKEKTLIDISQEAKEMIREGSTSLDPQRLGYILSILHDSKNDEKIKDGLLESLSSGGVPLLEKALASDSDLRVRLLLLRNIINLTGRVGEEYELKIKATVQEYERNKYEFRVREKAALLNLVTDYALVKGEKYTVPYLMLNGWESEFLGKIIETLFVLSDAIETQKNSEVVRYQETDLRNLALLAMKVKFGSARAHAEVFSVKGLTDIYISDPNNPNDRAIIECKRFTDKAWIKKGIDQLLEKYTQEKCKTAFLLTFIPKDRLTANEETYKQAITEHESFKPGTLNPIVDGGQPFYQTATYFKGDKEMKIYHFLIPHRITDP